GGRALGLSAQETELAAGLTAQQVQEWQARVRAGEGDQATVLRRVAEGTPAPDAVVTQPTVVVGTDDAADDGPAPSTGPAEEPAVVHPAAAGDAPAPSTGPAEEPAMVHPAATEDGPAPSTGPAEEPALVIAPDHDGPAPSTGPASEPAL